MRSFLKQSFYDLFCTLISSRRLPGAQRSSSLPLTFLNTRIVRGRHSTAHFVVASLRSHRQPMGIFGWQRTSVCFVSMGYVLWNGKLLKEIHCPKESRRCSVLATAASG